MRASNVEDTTEANGRRLMKQLDDFSAEGVCTEISAGDGMFEGSREHYFAVGQSALRCIQLAMRAARRERFRNILDFGSGFGRVLRVLKAAFPAAELAACDISPDAIEFCARTFGAGPIQSSETIADIHIGKQFDLIWCGTLLTNVDSAQFSELFQLFHSLLAKDGILVFTTHGSFVARRMRTGAFTYGLSPSLIPALIADYDRTGFGYEDYPEAVLTRLGVKRYGISISTPSWVCRQIEALVDLRILAYTERAWDNHQDSVACMNQQG
jgi:SAM-dependent methyltransferase